MERRQDLFDAGAQVLVLLRQLEAGAEGVRRFIDLLATEPRLSGTVLQTTGSKGWDGFAFAMVD